MSEIADLQQRLTQVEKQLRDSRRIVTISAVLALTGLILLWFRPVNNELPSKLRAESFSLIDASGNVQGLWEVTDKGPIFTLNDEKGVERVRQGVIAQGPFIALQDGAGRLRVVMDATKEDGPSISVIDEKGFIRGRVVVTALGSFVSLLDEKGKTRLGQGVTREGGGMTLLDEGGKERLRIGAPETGPLLLMKDKDGKEVFRKP
jgi:hypothetical protein